MALGAAPHSALCSSNAPGIPSRWHNMTVIAWCGLLIPSAVGLTSVDRNNTALQRHKRSGGEVHRSVEHRSRINNTAHSRHTHPQQSTSKSSEADLDLLSRIL